MASVPAEECPWSFLVCSSVKRSRSVIGTGRVGASAPKGGRSNGVRISCPFHQGTTEGSVEKYEASPSKDWMSTGDDDAGSPAARGMPLGRMATQGRGRESAKRWLR